MNKKFKVGDLCKHTYHNGDIMILKIVEKSINDNWDNNEYEGKTIVDYDTINDKLSKGTLIPIGEHYTFTTKRLEKITEEQAILEML